MVLEAIYVVRHGYRSNWLVNSVTGAYSTSLPTPTGIPSDPALASYGVKQSEQLAEKLATLDPGIDVVYSSPYYRCLQTLKPYVEKVNKEGPSPGSSWNGKVRCEAGIGEWHGLAPFDHPAPAPLSALESHFPFLDLSYASVCVPSTNGESIPTLHARVAYSLTRMIRALDEDPKAPKAVVICSHAASIIVMGRVLTGRMPKDPFEDDFRCGTCSLSVYKRRLGDVAKAPLTEPVGEEGVPVVRWKGIGVGGGWDCEANGDCSFLSGGEERGWKFSDDEAFMHDPNAYNDQINAAKETASVNQRAEEDRRGSRL